VLRIAGDWEGGHIYSAGQAGASVASGDEHSYGVAGGGSVRGPLLTEPGRQHWAPASRGTGCVVSVAA